MRELIKFVNEMFTIYTKKRVSRSAAEFSYFMTLSIFPLIICLAAIFTTLDLDEQSLLVLLDGVLPSDVLATLQEYINYVAKNYNDHMLVIGLVVMASSSAGAMRSFINIMSDIQGEVRYKGLYGVVVTFIFSIGFLLTFYLAIVIMVTGRWFIDFLGSVVGIHEFAQIWTWLRFIVLFLILLLGITLLYRFSVPKSERTKFSSIWGALAATFSTVVFSIIFSTFIGVSSKYSIVYGSLSAIIILMIWIYTCGLILIMGNVLNILLKRRKMRSFKECRKASQ